MAMSKMEEMGRILIHSGAEKVIRDVVCIYILTHSIFTLII